MIDLASFATFGGMVGVVIAATGVLKTFVPSQYSVAVATGTGLVIGGAVSYFVGGVTLFDAVFTGLIVGLSASGVYDYNKVFTR